MFQFLCGLTTMAFFNLALMGIIYPASGEVSIVPYLMLAISCTFATMGLTGEFLCLRRKKEDDTQV